MQELTHGANQDLRLIVTSDKQSFGNYNEDMEVMMSKSVSHKRLAIKIENRIVKVYNLETDEIEIEDNVYFTNSKNGLFIFHSTGFPSINRLMCDNISMLKYGYQEKENRLIIVKQADEAKRDKRCQAVMLDLKLR